MACVMEDALRALSYRQLTGEELRQRLLRRGHPEAAVEECLTRLREIGYLDERQFARDFVESRSRVRPVGRRKLVAELESKGIPREVVQEEVDRALPEEREQELAIKLAMKKAVGCKEPDRGKLCRRVYRFLVQRGFSGELAVRALAELGLLQGE
ncbi:MAG: regulatory protein RecX [Bacillota bacterium]